MHALLPRCLRALRALCETPVLAAVRDPVARERRAIAAVMRRVLGDVAGRDSVDLETVDPLAAQEVLRGLGDPSLAPEALGEIYEQLLAASTPSAGERRRGGRHYTPRPLAREVVRRALAPLWTTHDPRTLRVCDPAMGGGVFLLEALRQLGEAAGGDALGDIARGCVFGLDLDPLAVEITRVAVAREAEISPDDPCLVAALGGGGGVWGRPTPQNPP
jgi:type I restriction-modification system DNA methylase subunit